MDGHTYFPENQGQISSLLGRRLPCSSSFGEQMSLGFSSVGHLGAERRKSTDRELDALDVAKVPPARSSSSKRNRAAEVHNLSEKRRRSRINAKIRLCRV